MSSFLVLPGTKWQIPLIKTIKKNGNDVYLVNPEQNKGVFELADDFFASDIFAIDAIERFARKHRIDAILTDECDIAMPVIAELGKRLQLSTLSCDAARLFTNKYLMHQFCEKNGIKNAEYRLCQKEEDAIAFLKAINSPIIIKPIDSNASHGVFRVESEKEIHRRFNESMSFSRVEKTVLAERFISGPEFTVDGIKTSEQHYTLAISEKKHYSYNGNIANELLFTHSNEKYDYKRLKEVNDRFVMNSSLVFGLTHAEYKYENGEFYLIEIGARGGGNRISSLITKFMSGYDTYEYLLRCALGNIEHQSFEIPETYLNRAAALKFFDAPIEGGVVKEISGLEYLENGADIMDYALNFSKGDYIKAAVNDSERVGYYIACSESKEKLDYVMKRIEEHFRIVT